MSITLPRLAVAGACILLGACASPVTDPGPAPLPVPVPASLPAAPELAERNGQAVLHAQRGDVRQAIAIWEALLAGGALRAPRHAYLFRNLGHAYGLAGRDADAVTVLEQACLLDPRNALAWQQLAQVLARLGQHERAVRMQEQAHSLQAREVPRVQADAVAMPVPVAPLMDRIDITQSAGMAVLQRVAAASVPDAPRLRLEILNGNGKPGMAAALARSLAGGHLQVVRTGNAASFRVARTRVEYRPAQRQAARRLARQLGANVEAVAAACPASELRLILGRDIDPAMLHRYYVLQLELARQALARLG